MTGQQNQQELLRVLEWLDVFRAWQEREHERVGLKKEAYDRYEARRRELEAALNERIPLRPDPMEGCTIPALHSWSCSFLTDATTLRPTQVWVNRAEQRAINTARRKLAKVREERDALVVPPSLDLPPIPDLKTWSDRERATYGLLTQRLAREAIPRGEDRGGQLPRQRVLLDVLHASRGDKRYSAPTLVEVRCHRNTLVARVVRVQKYTRALVNSPAELDRGAWWVLLPTNPKGGHWVTMRPLPQPRYSTLEREDIPPLERLPLVDIPDLHQITADWGRQSGRSSADRVTLKCCCGAVSLDRLEVFRACMRSSKTGKKVTVKALPAGRKRKGKGLDVEKTGPRRQRPPARLHQRG